MARHYLKTWPTFFESIFVGAKTFEVRKNDRAFSIGDTLVLEEYRPDTGEYTGESLVVTVSYLLPGGQFGIEEGYCVMGIRPMKVKQKLSELFDALHTENAELHRKNRYLNEENLKLRAELFHLQGQKKTAFTPDELIGTRQEQWPATSSQSRS
jgi:hypothetical protein